MKKISSLIKIGIIFMILLISCSVPAASYSDEYRRIFGINDIIRSDNFPKILAPDWYHKPLNYAQLVQWYTNLEENYSDYLELFKANELYNTGIVDGGYDLWYLRITNESLGFHKPEVLFLGSPHGNENVGTIGLFWFTDWLMRMAFTDEPCSEDYSKEWLRWLIDHREIYIEVSHNPYGLDHGPQRYDYNGWDLNREADYDGPGPYTGGIWGSVNGKTLYAFLNNHTIRVGTDFHDGVRMLLYPWSSTHGDVSATSYVSGKTYDYAPPDFYFYDASALRLGDYIGNYGGYLNQNNIGTIPETVHYEAPGCLAAWAYGADVITNPVEDPYVEDEQFGNYPGAGALWISPEMSQDKDPPEYTFGNDTVHRFGAEVRRFVLHQTDIAQPYIRWQPGTVQNNSLVPDGINITFRWQVNGSLVVDHTFMQWGIDPNPANYWNYTTPDYDEHSGYALGGTGWDDADSGATYGVTYQESISIDEPGDYYFTVKAQVDQIYANIVDPEEYGPNSYLRIIKERTDDTYYEQLEGTDGTEEIYGSTWWYNPEIIHIIVYENYPPLKPNTPIGPAFGQLETEYTYTTTTTDPENDELYYMWDWGDGNITDWLGPYESGNSTNASHKWNEPGTYQIRVKTKDPYNPETEWSDYLTVTIGGIFKRADADNDNETTMNDAIFILNHLYVPGGPTPTCMDSADVDDNGEISMTDVFYLLEHLYVPGCPEPPAPFPECGPDPTPDSLSCDCYQPCMDC